MTIFLTFIFIFFICLGLLLLPYTLTLVSVLVVFAAISAALTIGWLIAAAIPTAIMWAILKIGIVLFGC
jgi:hypothetical protein